MPLPLKIPLNKFLSFPWFPFKIMIGCISPNSSSADHTLNTLRYADRLKSNRGVTEDNQFEDLNRSVDEEEDEQSIINRLKQKVQFNQERD